MIAVVLFLLVPLVGCGRDDGPTVAAGTTPTSASAAPAAAQATACAGSTADQSEPERAPRAELVAVRVAAQPGHDRVVFEFTGQSPGFDIRYKVRPVTEDASGKEVAIRGQFVVEVIMRNASGFHESGSESRPTYTGSTRIRPTATAVVQEVVRTGDFEAVLSWAVGLRTNEGFAVSRQDSPPRLVIDFCGLPVTA